MDHKSIAAIGYCTGLAANNSSCCMGPIILQSSEYLSQSQIDLYWLDMLYAKQSEPGLAALHAIADINERLAQITFELSQHKQPFLVFGGDHSSAVGTWSGCAAAYRAKGEIGLLWIDAHMDSHTPQSSLSGNIHGMPLAALLGYGPTELIHILDEQPKLLPTNICLVGIRSYEPAEKLLLEKLGIRIFEMKEISERGLAAVIQEAISIIQKNTVAFGLSLDLDALDPLSAPGVGSPVDEGLNVEELCESLMNLSQEKKFVGAEIVEFNPNVDLEHKTEKIISQIVTAVFKPYVL